MKPHWRIKPAQVKLLNVAISQLGLDRADFKARFGVASTKDLTNAQFDEAMKHLAACDFVYQPKVKKAPVIRAQKRVKQVYLAAIVKALQELGRNWPYAEGIAQQMRFPAKLEWCSPEQLHKVQIALIYELRKQAGESVARKPETLAKRRTGHVESQWCGEGQEED